MSSPRIVEASAERLARASTKYNKGEAAEAFSTAGYGLAFVVEEANDIVGWCWGYHLLRPDGTTMVYVHEIEVDEEARQQGYGRRLIDAMVATAREMGAAKVFLVTEKSNVAAMALYESAGAKPSEEGESVVFSWSFDDEVV